MMACLVSRDLPWASKDLLSPPLASLTSASVRQNLDNVQILICQDDLYSA